MEHMKKKTAYSIIFDESDRETIDRLKELTRMKDTSSVIRMALMAYHKELEPLYVRAKQGAPTRTRFETPEERVKAQMLRKKEEESAKRAIEQERALKICEALDGEVIEQEGGNVACKFSLYEKVGKRVIVGSRTVPFDNLHNSLIDTQYKGGTKQEIVELLAKQK